MRVRLVAILLLLLFVNGPVIPARAQANVQVISDGATLNFPETIQFSAEFKSGTKISTAVLEYGVNQLTCGTVQAEAFPAITASTDVKVQWTWEMRQSGSLPPGATFWWQWKLTDASGGEFTSPRQSSLWLDNTHPWQVITGGNINLHYYDGGADFGQQLHDAAAQALVRLSNDIGLTTEAPVDIYIFANSGDLKDAVLYAPSWVGGQAFPDSNIIILGIPTDQLDWGKGSEAHELTHVLVGHLTFSCLSFMPTWLNEGLAVYGEGGPTTDAQALFDQAKTNKTLPSLRSLIGQFSEESDRARLSYAEAYSVVNYMIQTYGQDKMLVLLKDLRDGQTLDEALQAAYGLNLDGLEAAWRNSIGAPLNNAGEKATPAPTPTIVPTIVPIGAVPIAQPQVSTPHPTEAASAPTQGASGPGAAATSVPTSRASGISQDTVTLLAIGGGCVVLVLITVGVPLFFILRRRSRRAQ
jgi:hypothetical protein